MTKYLYLLLLLFSHTNVLGNPKYAKIDEQSKSVPDSLKTPVEIAEFLTSKLKNEDEKVRALYIWITHNIQYDVSQINGDFHYNSYDQMVRETINTRKGICGHYAQLFHHMCKIIGIESYVISGYTRQLDFDEISELNHAWNAVRINNQYLFIDNTFAAGYVDDRGDYVNEFSDDYFLISPKELIKTHVPFDPVWQFLDNPVNNVDFKNKDFSKLNIVGDFDYKDTISSMIGLDTIVRVRKRIDRIKKSGITNILIREYLTESEQQIENHRYGNWISSYNNIKKMVNNAKDQINMGINFDHIFIGYMNKRFRNPKIDDEQIKRTIEKANLHFYQGKNELKKSKKLLNELEYSGENLENSKSAKKYKQELIDFIIELERHLLEVEPSIVRNTDYANRYLKKWKLLRPWVPYE
ncbi:transglutaminase domain-containing protein [Allomuricauda sp. XS_ASV26]|uniref:transglutaminase domain-containing protein n=1 Tax=Allomuricauda sp. XS_ASV26 TaxID=3241292 RepID=UPI0035186923